LSRVSDCLFCGIVAGSIPADTVLETEHAYAFRDINPVAPVHVLVIPRQHIAGVSAVGPEHAEVVAALYGACRQVAEKEGVAASGYRVVANVGADAGQTVHHLHLHVVGGRPMGWPPFPPRPGG
jgi:histidine triad (HIT) family protein